MATDTTELTFVRCPECRSLVPAMSTRCRMCGAGLGTDLKSDTGSSSATPTGRVRQKTTTTASASDFNDQIRQLREDQEPHEEMSTEQSPLDDFLESGAEEEATHEAHDEPMEAAPAAEEDFDDFDEDIDELGDLDDLDDFDDFDDFDDEEPAPEQQAHEEPIAEEHHQEAHAAPVQEEAPVVQPKLNTDVLAQAQKKVESIPTPQPKPRVVVEQGKGKFSKGLSFGGSSRFDAKPKQEVKAEVRVEPPAPVAPAAPVMSATPAAVPQEVFVEKVNEEEVAMKPEMKQPMFEREVEAPAPRPKAPAVAREAGKDTMKRSDQLGHLAGWLVSFADSRGSSIELREGRFFVSSTQLRATDLVLEDDTISTPHAMFTIDEDSGILVQDLKSERGVFVRTADATAYQRQYDTVVLEHGDWVRFGDLEFLVSVIAHGGAR